LRRAPDLALSRGKIIPFLAPFATHRLFASEIGATVERSGHVYYTLTGEERRVSASKLIWDAAQKSGWSADFERLEGMLLGYEEWQNDWWIAEYLKRTGKKP
jgi:hypothetical protein